MPEPKETSAQEEVFTNEYQLTIISIMQAIRDAIKNDERDYLDLLGRIYVSLTPDNNSND